MHTVGRTIAIAGLLAMLGVGARSAPGHATVLASDATITVQIGPATRALSATYGSLSPDWLTPEYDTSFWKPVQRVTTDVQRCVVQNTEDWQGLPMYWAKDVQSSAYFRQAFIVPEADSYAESTLILGKFTNEQPYESSVLASSVYINQEKYAGSYSAGINQLGIASYLHAGINILGFYGLPPLVKSASGVPCSAFGFQLIIHAQGLHAARGRTGSPAPTVTALRPADGARVTGSMVPLAWSPFGRAGAYLVHVWLRRADSGQPITASMVATVSLTVTGTTASIPTANMPRGAYAWGIAALDPQGAIIANWSASRTVLIE